MADNDITLDRATEIGDKLGVNWDVIDKTTFQGALKEEFEEHGELVGNDLEKVGKIAMAHFEEDPHYYQHHELVSHEAKEFWRNHPKPKITRGGGIFSVWQKIWMALGTLLLILAIGYASYWVYTHWIKKEGLVPMPGDPNRNILRRSRAPWMEGRYPRGGMLDYYFQTDPAMAVGDSFDACWSNPAACERAGVML